MRARRSSLALMAAAAMAIFSAHANAADTEVIVAMDEVGVVRLPKQAASVLTGNPSIADVSVQNGRTLVVTGKSFGMTNAIVLGADGKEILEAKIAVQSNRTRLVTVQRGNAMRQTYICAPDCQASLSIGDSTFEDVAKQVEKKQTIGQGISEITSAQ